ncbi:MAG: hypothetical protein LBP31_01600 [Holosporales bacterium]|jgi:NADH-quinone oxidoreductase subunit M|nr:hypothetical protein [Holosporales bacterium]
MSNIPLISTLICLPVISCFFVLISQKNKIQNAKLTALCGSIVAIIVSVAMLCTFDFSKNTVQLLEEHLWIFKYGIKYKVGIDKYSIFFILMTTVICSLTMLWILQKNIHKTKHFFSCILLFESFAIGAFVAYDLFLLLFFMEAATIPLFIMMHLSGKYHHKEAASFLLIYGMIGCLLTIISMLIIHNTSGTSDIIELYQKGHVYSKTCFWVILAGIGVKIPLFSLHHWLPKVHVDSPTALSVLLASIALKFSSIMMIKVAYHLFFDYLIEYANLLSCLCLAGAIIACVNIFFQKDLKRIFVYFSILHMNLYIIILLSGGGIKKFVFSVLYHSFIMAILFFVTDIIKTIFKTREIDELKEVNSHFIVVKRLALLSVLTLIGVPVSWGFITEILSVYSANCLSTGYALVVVAVILTSSSYIFFLYQSIFSNWTTNTIHSIDMFHASRASKNIVLYTLFGVIFSVGIFAGIFF